ncbi:hypothetical protein E2K98_15315 [Bacillus salipaludis]|uniref:Uncharacterized protein n=1 Tax=Bacillus salipaludis TaxID=2547811 RepID=A0A4V3ATQ4_9BACI|nr:hypothetical protein [Bacillus salipaludis]MDQ6598364.1 hypothetical protein [Bacillus salipaludis]TDK61072.1 hypothetical protein E2K98_15315 [Bacillus salipaludis]
MFFIPTKINIGGLKMGSPDHASLVSIGENYIVGVNVTGKKNQGYGQQIADLTKILIPIHTTYDDEPVDSPRVKINREGWK